MDNTFSISKNNWKKIIDYAAIAYDEFGAEIGGMAVVIQDENGDWEIKDPIILKQIITASNTHLDKDELAKYYTKTAKKYAKKNFRFCWWHSHHTMSAFWSGTDTDTIEEFNEGDFSFALVVNLKEEYKFRVSVWQPFEIHEDVELEFPDKERKVPTKLVNEVKELCAKPEIIGYNRTYNPNQRTLWHRQKKAGNIIDYTLPVDAIHYDYTYAYKLMEKLINGACEGIVNHSEYLNEIDEFNHKANEEETGVLIGKLNKKDWEEAILITSPGNHIIDTDMDAYNESFDSHARWGI